MRILALPAVPQFRDGPLLAVGDEDRVVAEALAATRPVDDRPLEDAGAAKLFALRRQRDELGDVARPPVVDALQCVEHRTDGVGAAEARRLDAGAAPEPVHLDARVLAEHPRGRVAGGTAEGRLRA